MLDLRLSIKSSNLKSSGEFAMTSVRLSISMMTSSFLSFCWMLFSMSPLSEKTSWISSTPLL